MDRFWMRTVVGCLAASAIGVLSSACAHNDSTLYIQGVLLPPATKTGGVCTYSASPTGPFQFGGLYDIGLASDFQVVMQLGNQMVQRGPEGPGSDPVHTETSRIVINGAEVTVADAAGQQLGSFTSVASTFVDVGNQGTSGLGIVGITGVDAPTAAQLCGDFPSIGTRKQLVLTIKAFGKTLGGTDVESQEFTYPVTVCKGCLVDFSAGCQASATMMIDTSKFPCNTGNDQPIACAACSGYDPGVCNTDIFSPVAATQMKAQAAFVNACAARIQ
jgi:hypothetical protein